MLLFSGAAHPQEAVRKSEAFVESVRKDGIAVIMSEEKPSEERYSVSSKGEEPIILTVLQVMPVRNKGVLRYRSIVHSDRVSHLRTGVSVLLREYREPRASYIGEKSSSASSPYKHISTAAPDGRDMVLIPAGAFPFGSDEGDRDESPKRLIRLESYYIDRCEVSNGDYLAFVTASHAPMPRSWGGVFPEKERELPVIVSWGEASAYAAWAGKRLPSEIEWEKAANGSSTMKAIQSVDGYSEALEKTVYPWGNIFDASRCNSREKDGMDAQEHRGCLPVNSGSRFDSAWGVSHMAGNAPEWTDSWYEPYDGNKEKNSRYGKKYKVIRGGAWYSSRERVRITSREIGGTPNLDDDVIAGFRCVRTPTDQDRR